jgi:hypothetical protein
MTQIVFEHLGAWVPTAKQPVITLENFKGNLTEQKYCEYSTDTAPGQGSYVNLYEVRDISTEPLTADEYIANNFYFDMIRAYLNPASFTRTQIFNLLRLMKDGGSKQYHAVFKLLETKKFRSAFRESLKNQLVNWISEEDHAYKSPLSPRQWEILTQYER